MNIRPVSDDILEVIFNKKSMGYLPLKTIEASKISLDKTKKLCQDHNINFKIIKNEEVVSSGAFFCWNDKEVSLLLEKHKEVLAKENIPWNSHEFINYIFKNWIDKEKQPNGYKICGFLYGNKNFIPLVLE